jgi:ABC-2 type transport system ATP-binding protein
MNAPAATAEASAEAAVPAISVRGLEKSFRGLPVLRGVDLDVAPGTVLALLGSNGAGKTTVVKIRRRCSTPTRGPSAWSGTTSVRRPRRCAGRSA